MTSKEAEQHTILMEQAAIFQDGMESPFWKELEKLLNKLRNDAIERILITPPDEMSLIAELQAIAKIPNHIRQAMMDTIAYAESSRQ